MKSSEEKMKRRHGWLIFRGTCYYMTSIPWRRLSSPVISLQIMQISGGITSPYGRATTFLKKKEKVDEEHLEWGTFKKHFEEKYVGEMYYQRKEY